MLMVYHRLTILARAIRLWRGLFIPRLKTGGFQARSLYNMHEQILSHLRTTTGTIMCFDANGNEGKRTASPCLQPSASFSCGNSLGGRPGRAKNKARRKLRIILAGVLTKASPRAMR